MKRYFLGMAAGYSGRDIWRHTFAVGFRRDCRELKKYLRKHYGDGDNTRVVLCKNGRSALCLALKAYFQPGDAVIVNGFTCYAVYEAIRAAGLTPIWADISREDLNFDLNALNAKLDASFASSLAPVVTGLASSIAPVVANARESKVSQKPICLQLLFREAAFMLN